MLEKCPALRKQTKTGGQRISALRSRQDEQQKNEDRLKKKTHMSQVRFNENVETKN